MLETLVLGVLFAKGTELVVGEGVKTVAKKLGTKTLAALKGEIAPHLALPANDEVKRALETAQRTAWQHLLREWSKSQQSAWDSAANPDQRILFEAALDWATSGNTSNGAGFEHSAVRAQAFTASLATHNNPNALADAAAVKRDVENAVWAEFLANVPISYEARALTIPPAFETAFRGGDANIDGWHKRFCAFATSELKDDAKFLALFTAEKLATIDATTARTEYKIDEQASVQAERHEELVQLMSREKGIPHQVLREVLNTLDEKKVPDDQIIPKFEAVVTKYHELLEQLAIQPPGEERAVTAARQSALTLMRAGDLDGAQQAFVDAGNTLRLQGEENARARAALLGEEAQILALRFRYRDAAERYATAAQLVAFDDDARAEWLAREAKALYQQGDEFGDNPALLACIALYPQLLTLRTRQRVPLDWARTQNNLGSALQTLGSRESGTARLEEAVAAYRAALEERTRKRVPLDWAMTQNNLGTALRTLGARESGTARLEQAVAAYRAALEECTRERVPLAWATTQNNLGTALKTLGARESRTARLKEAVAAYRAALEERTRKRVPLDWAMTQSNLADTSRILFMLTQERHHLTLARTAIEGAIEIFAPSAPAYFDIANQILAAIKALEQPGE